MPVKDAVIASRRSAGHIRAERRAISAVLCQYRADIPNRQSRRTVARCVSLCFLENPVTRLKPLSAHCAVELGDAIVDDDDSRQPDRHGRRAQARYVDQRSATWRAEAMVPATTVAKKPCPRHPTLGTVKISGLRLAEARVARIPFTYPEARGVDRMRDDGYRTPANS